MPNSPNKLSRFWQELKHRRVPKAITMYASTAYVILELVGDILVDPLNLPDWLPRLIILLAVVGFPIILASSWIFNFKKAEITITSVDAEDESPSIIKKRKFRVSDGIIVILLILVGVLIYPRIFQRHSNIRIMTTPKTIKNEFGESETRRIVKEENITNLYCFWFTNESEDKKYDWIQIGIWWALLDDFSQFNYINKVESEYRAEIVHLQEQINIALEANCPHFLIGSYSVNEGFYEITYRLYQTSNGSIKFEKTDRGKDLLNIIDSISLNVRLNLDIPNSIISSTLDLPLKEQFTSKDEAFSYYARSVRTDSNYFNVRKAIELDSTFTKAYSLLAGSFHRNSRSRESAMRYIAKAILYINRLPENQKYSIQEKYYEIHGDFENEIALAKIQYDLQPNNIGLLASLTRCYQKHLMLKEFHNSCKTLVKWDSYEEYWDLMLSYSYLLLGKPNKSLRNSKRVLKKNPTSFIGLVRLIQASLHLKDMREAEIAIAESFREYSEDYSFWSDRLEGANTILDNIEIYKRLGEYKGIFRSEDSEVIVNSFILNDNFVMKANHRNPYFYYPISDTVFVTFDEFIPTTRVFERDSNSKVYKILQVQREYTTTLWKEDSHILEARGLLEQGKTNEALAAFTIAYKLNPNHFYLANYIQHLEFILSKGQDEMNGLYYSNIGQYDHLRVFREQNKLFYETGEGLIYELLPLNETRFMIPSKLNCILQLDIEEDVRLVNLIFNDGTVERYSEAI